MLRLRRRLGNWLPAALLALMTLEVTRAAAEINGPRELAQALGIRVLPSV